MFARPHDCVNHQSAHPVTATGSALEFQVVVCQVLITTCLRLSSSMAAAIAGRRLSPSPVLEIQFCNGSWALTP